MNKLDELAEKYLQKYGRTGGSSIKTIHAYKEGFREARQEVAYKISKFIVMDGPDKDVTAKFINEIMELGE